MRAAGAADLTVTVHLGDEAAGPVLAGAGFAPQPEAAPVTGMFRDADPSGPVLPDGYRVRSVAGGEQAARVQAHQAAWRPATLPWPDGTPAVSPELTSRFTAGLYEEVRHTWLYDRSRDLVVEAPDGTLAPRADYPAPAQTYLAAGFEVVSVGQVHRRPGSAGRA